MDLLNKEKLELIALEHVADVIWIVDLDNKLVYVTPSVTAVLGYTTYEAMNLTILDVFTPKSISIIKRANTGAVNRLANREQTSKKPRILNLEMYHKNGSVIPVEINGSPISDDNGRPVGFLSVTRDITNLKQDEKRINRRYRKEKRLREVLEAEINKRSEFARVVVHELNTPLTSIIASAELLLQSKMKPPYDRITRNLQRSSSELNSRINELLELTKAEMGILQIRLRRINPSIMLKQIIKEAEPIINDSNIILKKEIPLDLSHVKVDKRRIKQVVQNLLTNSTKATPEGGNITIRALETDVSLIIQVQDTGRGIKRKDQKHIFEPYYRVQGIAQGYEGLGLGLSISKRLIELHNGQIWVESEVSQGSTFSFSIPLSE
ncbi:ATP-binding protein [Chloroflexota bacterium]